MLVVSELNLEKDFAYRRRESRGIVRAVEDGR